MLVKEEELRSAAFGRVLEAISVEGRGLIAAGRNPMPRDFTTSAR